MLVCQKVVHILCRNLTFLPTQLTYSMTRFGIYESTKNVLTSDPGSTMPFYQKVLLGGVAGTAGGFVGTPADMINVRYNGYVLSLSGCSLCFA